MVIVTAFPTLCGTGTTTKDSSNLTMNLRGVPLVFELIMHQNGETLLKNLRLVLFLSGIISRIAARASFSDPGSAQDSPSSRPEPLIKREVGQYNFESRLIARQTEGANERIKGAVGLK